MDDLLAFLTARLGEDEAAAKAWLPRVRLTGSSTWSEELNDSDLGPYSIEHAELHDPARTLREVEADRALLAEYEQVRAKHAEFSKSVDRELAGWWAGRVVEADRIIRIRAMIYSGHPDYRPEWKPPQP